MTCSSRSWFAWLVRSSSMEREAWSMFTKAAKTLLEAAAENLWTDLAERHPGTARLWLDYAERARLSRRRLEN